MIPHTYIELEAFPLTISGKINVKALPIPGSQIRSSYVAPANRLKELLVSLWDQYSTWGHQNKTRVIFQAPSIQEMAQTIAKLNSRNIE